MENCSILARIWRTTATKAKLLPSDEKKNIPVCSGEWSEDGIQKFFEKFKDSIVDPIRHRNRELLENIGIKVKGISEEVFDDSIGIEEVVRLLRSIKEFNETIFRILVRSIDREMCIKITFCQNTKCKNLDLEKRQCRLAPTRSGRLMFGKPHGTLRMHRGSDKGWHYREL